ncbi:MAG: succinate dehydrogenase assembly factor 2 [Methylococcales bacterium]
MRWLCRRGSLELDLILSRYLDRRYDLAPCEEQQLFETLLSLPDPELQRFFIAQEDPADPEFLNLVRIIRTVASNLR